MIEKLYKPYLPEIGFHPVDNPQKHCGYGVSYELDSSLGTGEYWFYTVDNSYCITICDYLFYCDVSFQVSHPPFLLIWLNLASRQTRMHLGGSSPCRRLGLYTGHEATFVGKIKKEMAFRGISVLVTPKFYNKILPGKYPGIPRDLTHLFPQFNGNNYIPEIAGALHQISSFRPLKEIAGMYYDSKVTEIMSILTQWAMNNRFRLSQGPVPNCDMDHLRSVMDYLNTNYTSHIYLDALCRHACMSRTKLTRLFKQVYGMTISDHIKTLRINLAKEMLADNHLKINTIANTVGFKFHRSFSEAFKHATGLTPNQYRKTIC
ncbi:AraC family transcriptional regulator [uncultured Desulfobacter sp.]|uniref:helix-turn-helix domain-containing protein n=1 Tax=uncultured Desulfobacter sp. TaxID=240139 RepID=UPI002AA79C77|nr:AraC family transcriptional regulator [uncultured Desulfobacter sp.]